LLIAGFANGFVFPFSLFLRALRVLRFSEVVKKFKRILTCGKRTGTAGIIATYKSKLRSRAQFVSTAPMPGHGCVMINLVMESARRAHTTPPN
jgi:hypothetical protein